MYILKRTKPDQSIGYLYTDGWKYTGKGYPIDLTNVIRFTEREMKSNPPKTVDNVWTEEYQWYGSYD